MARVQIKPAAIPRAGYEYQDLVGIEVLIRQYRDPELYAWVLLEADDTTFRALDDVVAARKDGSFEFIQVKFTVDSDRYELDWDWLLAKTTNGTSMLEKWAKSLARVAAMGPIHSAGLKTNRIPSAEFAKFLKGSRVDIDLLPKDIRDSVESACGGAAEAKQFFRTFDFLGGLPDFDRYENGLRDQIVPTDTDWLGWLVFRHNVRRWAIYQVTSRSQMDVFCGSMLYSSLRSAARSRSGRTLSFPMATARRARTSTNPFVGVSRGTTIRSRSFGERPDAGRAPTSAI